MAREFELALPAELDPAERRRLALDFAAELVQRHGCAADVAIHAPGGEGDHRNHHAHILLTTRRLGPDGFTEKTRELDDQKTGPAIVTEWRGRFAELQNARLEESGSAARVDHRSLAEQGLDRVPTRHLGPAASGYERRTGEPSRKRQDWAELASERLASAKAQGEKERAALRSNAATALYIPYWVKEMKQNDETDTQQPDIRGPRRLSESRLCELSGSGLAGNRAGAGRPAAIAAVVPSDEDAYRQGDMGLRRSDIRRESSGSGSGSRGERNMTTGKIGQVLEGIRRQAENQDDDQVQRDDGRSLAEKIAAGRAGLRSMHGKAKEEDAERKKRDEARKLGEEEAKRKAEQKQKQAQPEQKSSFKHPKPRG